MVHRDSGPQIVISRVANFVLDKGYTVFRQIRTDIRLDHGMVSFSFDDFPSDALHTAGRILEDHGWRGTYYTSMGLLGNETACGLIADEHDLNDCIERGHELANHTLNHVNCEKHGNRDLISEIDRNQRALPDSATYNFAYPFGSVNTRAMRLLSNHVTTGRGIRHGINSIGTVVMNLQANSIYTSNGIERNLAYVEENRDLGGWLIFYTHDVNSAPSAFGCTPQDFKRIVQAVKSTDLKVVTVEEGRKRLGLKHTLTGGSVRAN